MKREEEEVPGTFRLETQSVSNLNVPGTSRLRWRCRRGMRELDAILEGFLERCYAGLDDCEKRDFAAILEFPDPDLHAYLLGKAEPMDPDLARLLRRIREGVSAQT